MKPEKDLCSTRREFLKKTIKVTGYAIPAMMVFKMGSTKVWAQKYDARGSQDGSQDEGQKVGQNAGQNVGQNVGSSDPCKGVFEKIFKTSCW